MRGLKKAAETVKPIPAFYCCYLLRSTIRKQSLYVGSTPHPPRRLGQHNGLSKGGAVRTSKSTLRPWEMACIVTGFPSKIAALQFEWAWQNTHLTRHITPSERITQTHTLVRISPRTGKTRKRPARPRVSLTDKISNLHILLRVKSFARWPLQVKFFSEDAHRVWKKWDDISAEKIRKSIRIDLEHVESPSVESTLAAAVAAEIAEDGGDPGTIQLPIEPAKGIYALELGYGPLKPRIEKAKILLEASKPPLCCVCMRQVEQKTLALVCPADRCYAVSHLSCLSDDFLRHENNENAVVPIKGHCPRCQSETDWSTLVADLSLRLRGQAEIDKLFKKGRRKKAEVASKGKGKGKEIAGGSGDGGAEQMTALLNESDASEAEDEALPDDWVYYEEEQDDQYGSVQGTSSEPITGHSRHVEFIDLDSDEG